MNFLQIAVVSSLLFGYSCIHAITNDDEFLMYAQKGRASDVSALLGKVNINYSKNNDGKTALWYAAGRTNDDKEAEQIVNALLIKGADASIFDKDNGLTPLMRSIQNHNFHVFDLLIKDPQIKNSINHRNNFGQTALDMAMYLKLDNKQWILPLKNTGAVQANPAQKDPLANKLDDLGSTLNNLQTQLSQIYVKQPKGG